MADSSRSTNKINSRARKPSPVSRRATIYHNPANCRGLVILLCTGEHIAVGVNPSNYEHVPIPKYRRGMPGPRNGHIASIRESNSCWIEQFGACERRYFREYGRTLRQRSDIGTARNEHLPVAQPCRAVKCARDRHVSSSDEIFIRNGKQYS